MSWTIVVASITASAVGVFLVLSALEPWGVATFGFVGWVVLVAAVGGGLGAAFGRWLYHRRMPT